MLYHLGVFLEPYYGPFRLFTSHGFLSGVGLIVCFFLSWKVLPRFASRLPSDRGRAFAVQSEVAVGKPTGAGILFISMYLVVTLLVVPFHVKHLLVMICILGAMVFGYLDDRGRVGWPEYRKGLVDLVLSFLAALVMWYFQYREAPIWLPFTKRLFHIGPAVFLPGATVLVWLVINAVNCTDGIDGLSGTLSVIALLALGVLLHFIVGHTLLASYFLLPHYPDGARWAVMAFTMVGSLCGYLWHNAFPSSLLMGDAGSRAVGLLIGILVLASGNPLVILIVATVVFVNGGTGLIKVALLRFFKVGIFNRVRFPLHDHYRQNCGWSNTQVLVRFGVMQAMATLILMVILVKIR